MAHLVNVEGHGRQAASIVSDEGLVNRALAGDRSAFAELVDRYAAAVKAVSMYRVQDHHSAEDVAQDVFVTAYEKLSQLRVKSMFGRWILKIARQRATQMHRRGKAVSLEEAGELALPMARDSRVEGDELLSAVMRLPEREQRLIMLRYFSHQSVEQIAKITNRPIGTVTKQLSRGYERLRAILAEVTA